MPKTILKVTRISLSPGYNDKCDCLAENPIEFQVEIIEDNIVTVKKICWECLNALKMQIQPCTIKNPYDGIKTEYGYA